MFPPPPIQINQELILKRNENMFMQNIWLHVNDYSGFIHNFPNWKQPTCLSTDEWVNKLYYIQTTEQYSALQRNRLLIQVTTWMNFKCIMLTERCQTQKAMYYMIPFLWRSGEGKMIGKENRSVTVRCQSWGRERHQRGVMSSTSDSASGCTNLCICQNSQSSTLKWENFTIYKLHLKKPDLKKKKTQKTKCSKK